MHGALKKIISLVLIFSFLNSQIVFGIDDSHPSPKNNREINISHLENDLMGIAVLGGRFIPSGEKKPLILHIRDMHCNEEAQLNIARTIQQFSSYLQLQKLSDNDHPLLVLVEGAEGYVDTGLFSTFPVKSVREKATRKFVKHGMITGAEYLSITSPYEYPIKIVGIEDGATYAKDFYSYRTVISQTEKSSGFLQDLKALLELLKKKTLSQDLMKIEQNNTDYEQGLIDLDAYVQLLANMMPPDLDIHEYPNIDLLQNILNRQKGMNFERVDEERNSAIEQLSDLMTKNELANLVKDSVQYRLGKITSEAYFTRFGYYIHHYLPNEGFPELKAYIRVFDLQSKISHENLNEEINRLNERLVNGHIQSQVEKEVLDEVRIARVFERLLKLEMTREDIAFYNDHHDQFDLKEMISRLARISKSAGINLITNLINARIQQDVLEIQENAEKFYQYALKRDGILADKSIQALERSGSNVAVLITGGFHSDGVLEILRKKDIGYIIATPRINQLANADLYRSVMLDDRISIQALSPFSLFNHLASLLGPVMRDDELFNYIDTLIQMTVSLGIPRVLLTEWINRWHQHIVKNNGRLDPLQQRMYGAVTSKLASEPQDGLINELPMDQAGIRRFIANSSVLASQMMISILKEFAHSTLVEYAEGLLYEKIKAEKNNEARKLLGIESLRERKVLVRSPEEARSDIGEILINAGVHKLERFNEVFDILARTHQESVVQDEEKGRYHDFEHILEVSVETAYTAYQAGLRGEMLESAVLAALLHDIAVVEQGASIYDVHERLSAARALSILSNIEHAPGQDQIQNVIRFILFTQFTGAFFSPNTVTRLLTEQDIVEVDYGTAGKGLGFRTDELHDAPVIIARLQADHPQINEIQKAGATLGVADLKSALSSERYLRMLEGLFDEYLLTDRERGSTFLANLGWVSAYNAFFGTAGFIDYGLLADMETNKGRLTLFQNLLGINVLDPSLLQNLWVNRAIFSKLQPLIEKILNKEALNEVEMSWIQSVRENVLYNRDILSAESSDVLDRLLSILIADHHILKGEPLSGSELKIMRALTSRPFFAEEVHRILIANGLTRDIDEARKFYREEATAVTRMGPDQALGVYRKMLQDRLDAVHAVGEKYNVTQSRFYQTKIKLINDVFGVEGVVDTSDGRGRDIRRISDVFNQLTPMSRSGQNIEFYESREVAENLDADGTNALVDVLLEQVGAAFDMNFDFVKPTFQPDLVEAFRAGRMILAVHEGNIVGFLQYIVKNDVLRVEILVGDQGPPETKIKGVGTALMDQVIAITYSKGMTKLRVRSFGATFEFYQKYFKERKKITGLKWNRRERTFTADLATEKSTHIGSEEIVAAQPAKLAANEVERTADDADSSGRTIHRLSDVFEDLTPLEENEQGIKFFESHHVIERLDAEGVDELIDFLLEQNKNGFDLNLSIEFMRSQLMPQLIDDLRNGRIIFAVHEGNIVGFLNHSIINKVFSVEVLMGDQRPQESRVSGVGTALMDLAMNLAHSHHLETLQLLAFDNSLRFYLKYFMQRNERTGLKWHREGKRFTADIGSEKAEDIGGQEKATTDLTQRMGAKDW
ncbi:MAG: hypothetical protein Q8Q33_03115, partial [Chlamydiota bacterium]|nr:hypothetical protein [Chlamydiota bacterium]